MKNKIELLGLTMGLLAVVIQFRLILMNSQEDLFETIVRFFSYFTILTNILVSIFYAGRMRLLGAKIVKIFHRPEASTAILTFILVVGIVYQFALRHVWEPTGIQMIVDELLHTVNPLIFLIYWMRFDDRKYVFLKQISLWLLYPLVYIGFILVRGYFSGFFPYYFIDLTALDATDVIRNIFFLSCFIYLIMVLSSIVRNRYQLKGM